VYSEIGEERFGFGFAREEVLTGPHAVETNKPHDSVHVRSLGVNGVVVQTEYLRGNVGSNLYRLTENIFD
jgi:hypothetical protein